MPAHKRADVDRNRDPDDADEARFTRLVAQHLLCEQRAGAAASQGEQMQCLFGGAPAPGNGRRLVEGVGHERCEAEANISKQYRKTKAPAAGDIHVERREDWNYEQPRQRPELGRLCAQLSGCPRV